MRFITDISGSEEVLRANLSKIVRVAEWAECMGYNCSKKFARNFLRYYHVRPQKMLTSVRINSISSQLREGKWSNFEIARAHGISDDEALNKYINYHMGFSPSQVKCLDENQLKRLLSEPIGNGKIEKLGSKIR